jgi:hypothetical protein
MATLWDITEKSVGMQTAAKIIKYIAESTSAVANNGDLLERAATLEALGMKFAEDCRELIDAINEYEQSKAEAENIAREVMDEAIAERKKKQAAKPAEPVPPVPEHITDTNLDDDADEPADIPEYTEAENTDLGISILIKDEAYNND